MRRLLIVAAAALLLTACPAGQPDQSEPSVGELSASAATQSPSPEPSPPPSEEDPSDLDLSGTWAGTWENSVPDQSTGTFQIEWEQSLSEDLEGTITIAGSPCITGGKITGSLKGQNVTFGAVQGESEVSYEGSVNGDGNAMSGTYSTDCGDAQGVSEATLVG